MSNLRCHLLIGPPASGKTSIAKILAPLLKAEIISTDAIREELWGDEFYQGPWEEIEEILHARLKKFVAEDQPVLIDATHAMRAWRLAITQGIKFNKPVEWIGWWIKTPKNVCLKWNQQRDRTIEEEVIHQYSAALAHKDFSPNRSEGFTSFIYFDPSMGKNTKTRLEEEINRLPKRISAARNKEKSKNK